VVFGRVSQALRFLGLVYEDGRPSDKFQALAGAPDDKYKELLDKIIREAYRAEFGMIDPGKDTQSKIMNAFQPYQPRSQTMRMVMLFLALCREAGIPVLDAPRQRQMKETPNRKTKTSGQDKANNRDRAKTDDVKRPTSSSQPQDGYLFGVTEDDIAILDESGEFDEVWLALGKVAKARARAKKQALQNPSEEKEISEGQASSSGQALDKNDKVGKI
jgi:hypothetical protein